MCDCRHAYWREGFRSYGSNIPDSCQGAYFPGDEPGWFCDLYKDFCGNPEGDTPEDCEIKEPTDILCKKCEVRLVRDGRGVLYCPECLHILKN